MASLSAPVVIVGAGFAGTMLAARLAKREVRSILVGSGDLPATGKAYSTTQTAHLLNVRAKGMSAWPDEPDHFTRFWSGGDGDDFAPRAEYGRYLQSILDDAATSGFVTLLQDEAVDAFRDGVGWAVTIRDSRTVSCDQLVLATGNEAPQPLPVFAGLGERYIADPWSERGKQAIDEMASSGEAVLIVGTGLTMVDVALSLDAADHNGEIVAVSRRGLLPRVHDHFALAPVDLEDIPLNDIVPLWRWLRKRSEEHGWRAATDALRPHTQSVWQRLPAPAKGRFLRHARPWWDVHRHRIAPTVANTIDEMMLNGQLEVLAGSVVEANATRNEVLATIRRRGSNAVGEPRSFGLVFNCTGPLGDLGATRNPLLRSLLSRGEAMIDDLRMGFEVKNGSVSKVGRCLWALGPLTKGSLWEITAVPDIRLQVARTAAEIEAVLNHAEAI